MRLHISCRDVVGYGVTKYVFQSRFCVDILTVLPDDDGKFYFCIDSVRGTCWKLYGVQWVVQAPGGFHEYFRNLGYRDLELGLDRVTTLWPNELIFKGHLLHGP